MAVMSPLRVRKPVRPSICPPSRCRPGETDSTGPDRQRTVSEIVHLWPGRLAGGTPRTRGRHAGSTGLSTELRRKRWITEFSLDEASVTLLARVRLPEGARLPAPPRLANEPF